MHSYLPNGADHPTPAQRAAALLPSTRAVNTNHASPVALFFGLVVLGGAPLGLAGWLTTKGGGWLFAIAVALLWLSMRVLLPRLPTRAFGAGVIAVDRDGTVRLLSGLRGVVRMGRLYDVGVKRWYGGAVLFFLATFVLYFVILFAIVAWDPSLAFLLASGPIVFMLLLAEWSARAALIRHRARSQGLRQLDEHQVLPVLALYCRHHGAAELTQGVPADRLAALCAAHPVEAVTARRYAGAAALMQALAGGGSA